MNFNVIATGSNGNAVVIDDCIMIDCGVPFKALQDVKKQLKLVLLTHVHSDHFNPSTVRALHRERPALRWGCCEWMVGPLLEAGVDKRVIDVMQFDDTMCYWRLCAVQPVQLVHDVPNSGWRIRLFYDKNDEWLFYTTDTGTLDGIEAKGYDYYLIEANHKREELEARAKEKLARGEFSYEMRAAANHLSEEQALEWLYEQMGPNSKYMFLHQHKGGFNHD